MDPGVIYIGMSRHVTRRLDNYHDAIARYRADSGDPDCEHLWFADWESPWSNRTVEKPEGVEGLAYVCLMERKLLLDFVRAFNRYPQLNRS